MALKIAINGYGRIGRQVLRAIHEYGRTDEFDVVAINLGLAGKGLGRFGSTPHHSPDITRRKGKRVLGGGSLAFLTGGFCARFEGDAFGYGCWRGAIVLMGFHLPL